MYLNKPIFIFCILVLTSPWCVSSADINEKSLRLSQREYPDSPEETEFPAPTSCSDVGEIAKVMHLVAQESDDKAQFLEISAQVVSEFEKGFKDERNYWMASAIAQGNSAAQAHDDFVRQYAPIRKSAFVAATTAWEWREKPEAEFFLHIIAICNRFS